MAKMDLKVVMYSLLSVLLLQLLRQVGAVDIIFYADTRICEGTTRYCSDIGPKDCCNIGTGAGSVRIAKAASSVLSKVYTGGACTTEFGSPGSGTVCYTAVTGGFTGALWYNASRRSLLGELASAPCESQVKPNGVSFTEDSTKGHWVLTSSDADELYSQLQNVPDAEKTNWLKSRGATYNEV